MGELLPDSAQAEALDRIHPCRNLPQRDTKQTAGPGTTNLRPAQPQSTSTFFLPVFCSWYWWHGSGLARALRTASQICSLRSLCCPGTDPKRNDCEEDNSQIRVQPNPREPRCGKQQCARGPKYSG